MKRSSIEVFFIKVLGALCLFTMHIIIGRYTGKEDYGIFSFVLSLAGLLAILAPFGWAGLLMRLIAQYTEQKKWALLRGVFFRAHQITFISSVTGSLLLWGVTYIRAMPDSLLLPLRFSALLLPLIAFTWLRRRALIGLKRTKSSIAPDEIALPLLVIMVIYLFSPSNAGSVLAIYVAFGALIAVFSAAWLWRCLPPQVRSTTPTFATSKWTYIALPMMFGQMNHIIMNRTDILMLGIMADMDTVGLYNAANRIALLNVFVLGVLGWVAAPMLAASYHGNRIDEFKAIIHKSIIWSSVASLPLFITILVGAELLLSLFGPEFKEGAMLLRILTLGQFCNAVTGITGTALLMSRGERQFALSLGIVALFNIIGNIFAIMHFGAIGAACVTAVSAIVINAWQFMHVYYIIKIKVATVAETQ